METPAERGSGRVGRGRGSAGLQRGGRAGHRQHNSSSPSPTGKRKYNHVRVKTMIDVSSAYRQGLVIAVVTSHC